MLTPALNEVLSSLVPLRYKWSESVSYAGYVPAPFSQIQNPVDIKFGFPYNGMEYEMGVWDMKCPFCSHENTRVIDSRPAEENNSIRRRRVCDECGKRFTTYEKIETIPLIIIKKDNNRETYDRSKIEAGVLRACHKRPISVNQINQLIDEVETEIFNMEEKEIPSDVIGELVMNKLKDLEAVAYVRFASVYREFKDINTFMDELKKVISK